MTVAERRRVQAFERAVVDRIADELVPFKWGTALFTHSLPAIRDLNFLRVDRNATDVRAQELESETHRLQGAASLPHRKVAVENETLGAALASDFAARGWKIDRFVVMAFRGPRPDPGESGRRPVVQLDLGAYREVHNRVIREESPGLAEDVVRQLLGMDEAIAGAIDTRYFGALQAQEIGSVCKLYSDGSTAQIEDVATLEAVRGRGLATALMWHALAHAFDTGHGFIYLVADDDDWPKEFYARLGFEPIGLHYQFVIPGDTGYGWDRTKDPEITSARGN